jgi:hypothetical protein
LLKCTLDFGKGGFYNIPFGNALFYRAKCLIYALMGRKESSATMAVRLIFDYRHASQVVRFPCFIAKSAVFRGL